MTASDLQDEERVRVGISVLKIVHEYHLTISGFQDTAFMHLCVKSNDIKTMSWYYKQLDLSRKTTGVYTMVIAGYGKAGELEKMEKCLNELISRYQNDPTCEKYLIFGYQIAIERYMEHNQPEMAIQAFYTMRKKGFIAPASTTDTILQHYLKKDDYTNVLKVLEIKKEGGFLITHEQFYELARLFSLQKGRGKSAAESLIQIHLGCHIHDEKQLFERIKFGYLQKEENFNLLVLGLLEILIRRVPSNVTLVTRFKDFIQTLGLFLGDHSSSLLELYKKDSILFPNFLKYISPFMFP